MNLLFLANKRRNMFPVVSPDLVGAYSLRRIFGYNGNLIRVRRSSDNAEQDIGFSGNDLDTSGMLNFILSEGNKYQSDFSDLTGWTNTNSVITSEDGIKLVAPRVSNGPAGAGCVPLRSRRNCAWITRDFFGA